MHANRSNDGDDDDDDDNDYYGGNEEVLPVYAMKAYWRVEIFLTHKESVSDIQPITEKMDVKDTQEGLKRKIF